MTTPSTSNGKPTTRKQLSDQLDRLDGIIDTLAVGLNQAVADACREGARAAVREVILELISNPDLMAAVRATVPTSTVIHVTPDEPTAEYPLDDSTDALPAPQPPTPPAPKAKASFLGRVKAGVKSVISTVTGAARTLVKSVEGAVKPATDALKLTGTTRTVVSVALGVGVCAGALCLFCPAWMAAAVTGATGAAAVVAGYIGARINALVARPTTDQSW